MDVKAGNLVKLIGIPPDCSNDEQMQTRAVFQKCVGQAFVVDAVEEVEGLNVPLIRLNVGHVFGKAAELETIWDEPEYIEALSD